MRFVLQILTALGALFVATAAAAHPLEELYNRALERDETFMTALIQAKSATSTLRQTASTAWPTVSLNFGTSFSALPGITGSDEGEDRDSPERFPTLSTTSNFQLNINHQIYQFGRLDAELERDDWQSRAAWLSVTQAQAQVQKDIAQAYLNHRTAVALQEIREIQLGFLVQRQVTVEKRVAEGFLDRNDLLAVNSEVTNGQISVVEARRQAAIAQASLARASFTPDADAEAVHLAGRLNRLPNNLDSILLFAQENTVDVLLAETLVRAAQAGEWAVARASLPSLSWQATHTRGLTDTNIFNNDLLPNDGVSSTITQDTRLGFNLSVPIFSGGLRQEQRVQARDQIQLALRQLNAIREAVDAEIRRQWAIMEAEQAALNEWYALIRLEQERVDNAERLLAEGFINLEEAIQSRARLQALQAQIVQTSTNSARAKFEILHFLGLL